MANSRELRHLERSVSNFKNDWIFSIFILQSVLNSVLCTFPTKPGNLALILILNTVF